MWRALHDAWWRLATHNRPHSLTDALACSALQTGSVVYGVGVALRNSAYDRGFAKPVRLPCRVVSVGNLTVGGTGKTACVELIAKKLTALGRQVAVLSRGYGGSRGEYWLRWVQGRLQVNGQTGETVNGLADEPQLLAEHLEGIPVIVGSRRDRTGGLACTRFASEVVVLDDGFQHRQLARDCEIVLVHARMPFGGWPLLPRGPMREPLGSLRRAHIIVVTKADEALERLGAICERLQSLNPDAGIVTAVHEPTRLTEAPSGQPLNLPRLNGRRVALVSSIGDPAGFEATMQRLHATIHWSLAYPDHHRYTPQDWDVIAARVERERPEAVVTTEKDWVRLRPCAVGRAPLAAPLWVLGIQMTILSGEEDLDARLAALRTG